MSATVPTHLLTHNALNLSHVPLRLAVELFNLAFGSQTGIVCRLPHILFYDSPRLVRSAFDFVLHALCHLVSPMNNCLLVVRFGMFPGGQIEVGEVLEHPVALERVIDVRAPKPR